MSEEQDSADKSSIDLDSFSDKVNNRKKQSKTEINDLKRRVTEQQIKLKVAARKLEEMSANNSKELEPVPEEREISDDDAT